MVGFPDPVDGSVNGPVRNRRVQRRAPHSTRRRGFKKPVCSQITDIVAIDGPVGAGKSSVGRRVAELLGFAYLDTGAMYRAATWWAIENGADLDDPEALTAITRMMPLHMTDRQGVLRVLIGAQDITEAIRTPEITRQIYKLDHVAGVRDHLVTLQREFGAQQPTVADGRDMGTVVFPQARLKIFLDASPEIRAERRYKQLKEKGLDANLPQLVADIRERDARDRSRPVAPLCPAEDAVLVDSTQMSIAEVLDHVLEEVRRVFPEAIARG